MSWRREYVQYKHDLEKYDLSTAKAIQNKLKTEAIRIRNCGRISHDEALKIISQEELTYLLNAQLVHNNLIIERKTRGSHYYEL